MTKNSVRYYALLPDPAQPDLTGDVLHSVLDMLRYDRCQVEQHERGHWLLASPHPFTLDRWASFGIKLIIGAHYDIDGREVLRRAIELYREGSS